MANWKKIAAAFGRASEDPELTENGRKLLRESYNKLSPSDEKKSFDIASDYAANEEGARADLGFKSDDSDVGFDISTNDMNERALQRAFETGFEKALAKRRGKIRDAMGDARDADEAADAGINDIRKAAIEMLESGQDIGDVLRILKGE